MKKLAVILLISGACLAACILLLVVEWSPRGNGPTTRPIDRASSTSEDPTVAAAPEASDNAVERPTTDEQTERNQEGGGVSIQAAPITARPIPGAAQRVDLVNAMRNQLSASRARTYQLESDVERLQLEIDECRNGTFSVLGTLHALPEWAAMNTTQRITVTWFLQRFPIHLQPGEATLIATHTSPTGDTYAELIAMLGMQRVRDSMSPEARASMQANEPDEWREYFGMSY